MQSEHNSAPDSGHADMAEHIRTWNGFLSLMKWLVISSVALLVFLAIFRTHG
ncbi:MAG TPA: aa3-type cytochrome c oxidase subunit IV [Rhizomicrobium sp.]|jgi:hypothetical protein|nr:aa3-type cytochrome c oxidase subunit IV [Rhizomicrobium sp.]